MASALSSDEGEIVENSGGDVKATALPHRQGTTVDRPNRQRGRDSRSPDGGRSDHRSGSPRGAKRPRERDGDRSIHGSRAAGSDRDPRRFRVHYEESSRYDGGRGRRPRGAYEDLDRPSGDYQQRGFGYDDRDRDRDRDWDRDRENDRYPDKRARNRSRSPYRPPARAERGRRDTGGRREGGRRDFRALDRDQADSTKYSSAQHDRQPREESTSNRARPVADAGHPSKVDAKSVQGSRSRDSGNSTADDTPRNAPGPEAESQQDDWEEPKPADEEAEIERRRRRREELLRKSRGSTPMQAQLLSVHSDKVAALTPPASAQNSTPHRTEVNTPRSGLGTPPPLSPSAGHDVATPEEVPDLFSDQGLINTHGKSKTLDEDGPSAADYDPTADMREDERRDELRHGNVGALGEARDVQANGAPEPGLASEPEPKNGGGGEDDADFDMFAEDFDEKYVPPSKPAAEPDHRVEHGDEPLEDPGHGGGILEGDDKDGYYKIRPGEVLNGRYQIQSTLGRGMFSGVARAMDVTSKKLVAIKIMRNNDALRKGGYTEIAILQKLNGADPEGKKHIVRFERAFDYKDHLCMAFENLSLNLREVLKKFGNNVGINLRGVRAYAYQIFVALGHMRKCSVIHADLKPDNILVNEQRNVLKICDLGTAIDRSDAATAHTEITPYLVSRFYRAPEIILGMPYDYAVDTWSIGCTLYEMYTGKILFTGDSNNQMLRAIMEIRGKISRKLYQRGELWSMHFDEAGNFISQERDKVLGKAIVRTLAAVKPTRDLRTRLLAASAGMSDAESRELNHFHDLLDRCLNVNPDKRITPADALKHPFFTSGKTHAAPSAASTAKR